MSNIAIACPPPADGALAARKRRRRAPTTGAHDDCFTCLKRSTKCDRRRPYCSQCLEFGNECSGYKTQLTWGVGVASRGKLRGLSLPIATSAPVPKSPTATRHRATSSISRSAGAAKELRKQAEKDAGSKPEAPTVTGNPFTNYDFSNMASPPVSPDFDTSSMPSPSLDWHMQTAEEYMQPPSHVDACEAPNRQGLLRQSLQRLRAPAIDHGEATRSSGPTGPLSAYSGSSYASPIESSFAAEEVPYLTNPIYRSYPSQESLVDHGHGVMIDPRGPTSCPDNFYSPSEMASSLSSLQSVYETTEVHALPLSPTASCHPDLFYDEEIFGN